MVAITQLGIKCIKGIGQELWSRLWYLVNNQGELKRERQRLRERETERGRDWETIRKVKAEKWKRERERERERDAQRHAPTMELLNRGSQRTTKEGHFSPAIL